jgi:hypothetical protein
LYLFLFDIGQQYQLHRDVSTNKFSCPVCPHTDSTTKGIQKHCKDHALNTTTRRSSNRYHPYGDVSTDQDNTTGITAKAQDVTMSEPEHSNESSHLNIGKLLVLIRHMLAIYLSYIS